MTGAHNQANLTISTLTAGDHSSIHAVYSGNADYLTSTSADMDLNVMTATWTSDPTANPSITAPSSQTKTEGDSVSLSVSASDPNSYTLTYAAINLPGGLSINSSTGVITGTVAYGSSEFFGGVYTPTIFVVNGHGGTATATFTWTVNHTTALPTVTSPSNQTSSIGDAVSYQITATDPDSDPLSYSATNLPDGLDIDPDTGLISGTVAADAASSTAYSVTVDVANAYGDTAKTFSWTVNIANLTPQLGNPGNQANSAGDQVSLPLSANAPDGAALTYFATNLPAGLSLDPVSGIISGTIANSAARTAPYLVTVIASNGSLSTSQSFAWTVAAIAVTNPGDQSNVDGDAVSVPMSATDASGGTLIYSASGLPSGLSINSSTGVISGTIGSGADASSPYSVTITAGDGTNSGSTSFAWDVAHQAVYAPADQSGIEGQPIYLQITGNNGGGTMTYSAAGLPSGLSISSGGLITGTLSAGSAGSHTVTVTGTESSHTATAGFTWTVMPQISLALAPHVNAAGDPVSFAVNGADALGAALAYSASGLPSGLSIDSATGLIHGTISTSRQPGQSVPGHGHGHGGQLQRQPDHPLDGFAAERRLAGSAEQRGRRQRVPGPGRAGLHGIGPLDL